LIGAIVRTGLIALRRDRGALALSFLLPLSFFSIFAVIFGGRRDITPKITVLVVDEDRSRASERLIQGLEGEHSLSLRARPASRKGVQQPEYTAATAETAVKAGTAPVALVIPSGFGKNPISFGSAGRGQRPTIRLLQDSSDMVAPQLITGLLQKVAMTAMPDVMAEQGSKYMDEYAGGFTPEQHKKIETGLAELRKRESAGGRTATGGRSETSGNDQGMLIPVTTRDVVGENKNNPMVSFYAAAIGVMFLLFTASGTSGSLLDEAESGTLDRVLSSRVSMGTLLAGKLAYSWLLAFSQLVLMFVWAWLVFKVDFLTHIPGFVVMGLSTAFAVSAFGILLRASAAHEGNWVRSPRWLF
jgi:ABC-2 type transport system permease protein